MPTKAHGAYMYETSHKIDRLSWKDKRLLMGKITWERVQMLATVSHTVAQRPHKRGYWFISVVSPRIVAFCKIDLINRTCLSQLGKKVTSHHGLGPSSCVAKGSVNMNWHVMSYLYGFENLTLANLYSHIFKSLWCLNALHVCKPSNDLIICLHLHHEFYF